MASRIYNLGFKNNQCENLILKKSKYSSSYNIICMKKFSLNLHQNCWTRFRVFSTAVMWSVVISIFASDSKYELAQQFIELSWR